jgi:hypothetical protein
VKIYYADENQNKCATKRNDGAVDFFQNDEGVAYDKNNSSCNYLPIKYELFHDCRCIHLLSFKFMVNIGKNP